MLICEELSHAAGFGESVGNWIAPNGELITGGPEEHHYETLIKYLGCNPPENQLRWMNEKVEEGFIRLVFRGDVVFQVNAKELDEIWGSRPNYKRMMEVVHNLETLDADVHIFSRALYVIGHARDIGVRAMDKLQVRINR